MAQIDGDNNTDTIRTESAQADSVQRVGGCECQNWCDVRPDIRMITGHHGACPKRGSIVKGAQAIIAALVKGMENWAADEDGIHPDAWEAYKRGKAAIGQYDWKE